MQSKSSYSVMTRAKARYGKRLSLEEYDTLASCVDLREVVSFLRTKPLYAPYFEQFASDASPSKLKIESALRKSFYDRAQSLGASERSVGEYIIEYIDLRREADFILDYIIYLSLGTPEKAIFKLFSKTNTGTKLDPAKLIQMRTPAELNRYISKTKYAPLISVLPKTEKEKFDISLIEATVDRIRVRLVLDEIKNHFTGETAKELSESILMRVEMTDIQMIYRAKKYYGLSPDHIRGNLIGMRCFLSQTAEDSMIAAQNAENVVETLRSSGYASKIKKYGIDNVERFCQKAALEHEVKRIHFSSDPVIVLQAYLRFAENESENIIKITEGISYKKSKEEILAQLMIPEQERDRIGS